MLSQVNYRVPNMRFLRERLTVGASSVVCGWGGGGWDPLTCGPDQRSSCVPCRTWSSAAATSPMGSLLSCTAASCTTPRRRCMSHLPPSPTALVPALPRPSRACLSPDALLGGFWVPLLQLLQLVSS